MTEHGIIPSPLATCGAGTMFDQHVGAMFLALLLVRESLQFSRTAKWTRLVSRRAILAGRQATFWLAAQRGVKSDVDYQYRSSATSL